MPCECRSVGKTPVDVDNKTCPTNHNTGVITVIVSLLDVHDGSLAICSWTRHLKGIGQGGRQNTERFLHHWRFVRESPLTKVQ